MTFRLKLPYLIFVSYDLTTFNHLIRCIIKHLRRIKREIVIIFAGQQARMLKTTRIVDLVIDDTRHPRFFTTHSSQPPPDTHPPYGEIKNSLALFLLSYDYIRHLHPDGILTRRIVAPWSIKPKMWSKIFYLVSNIIRYTRKM